MLSDSTSVVSSELNQDKIRADFPVLHQEVNGSPLVYLDSAASTQKPKQVIDAIKFYYEKDHSNVHRGLHELSNRSTIAYESARKRVADFLNAGSDEQIIFTRGTTESINLVAYSWGEENISQGDVILVSEMEHHSNMVPWQILAERKKAQIKYVAYDAKVGALDLEHLKDLLADQSDRVKLFACTHVSNTLALVNPVKEICTLASEHGVMTVIDGAQSAGHMPVDVEDLGCDFYAMSGHKACGPTGIGVLYGKSALLEKMLPWQGGGEMISTVNFEGSTWKSAPHKFEAGTPNIADAIGLHAALDYLDALGRDAVAKHDSEMSTYAYEKMKTVEGIQILGPSTNRRGMVTFAFENLHAHDVVEMANQFGVALRGGHHCNQPLMKKLGTPATARASFYLYNTQEEIDRLCEVTLKVKDFFA